MKKHSVDSLYVKDLEKLVERQEKKIKKLELGKAKLEIGAASFVECMIQEYDTVPGGMASRLREMVKNTKYYANDTHQGKYCFDINEYDFNALKRATRIIFGVDINSLKEIGLELNVNKNADVEDMTIDDGTRF